MCNIVCNGHNDNPVCGSDSVTYDTPCHVREASCLKQQKIDIRHVGRCQGNELMSKAGLINTQKWTESDVAIKEMIKEALICQKEYQSPFVLGVGLAIFYVHADSPEVGLCLLQNIFFYFKNQQGIFFCFCASR